MLESELKEKMGRVAKSLSESRGGLKLFALNWRNDLEQWDILVGADWVDYDKMRDTISIIFQEIKKEFNGQYAMTFSGIHPLKPSEPVVQSITSAFVKTNDDATELTRVQFGNLVVDRMLLFISAN